ncbi:MAG: hydroxyacylglutathione hydrolase [Moraxellaceae bacterium]|nr:hydroxyacylglutathione hydrolase [Moraxellaceae bacterium]
MLTIQPINAFNDNYIWAIINANTQQCIVVDSGEAQPVIDFIKQTGLELVAIWITHKHYDHIGGVAELQQKFPHVEVTAHAEHGVRQDITVSDNSQFSAWDYPVEVWHIAGHTENHLAYLLTINNQKHVFCGDTLFSGGCGRVFTGDMSAMFHSLQRLASLDDNSLFYPAHEYTLSNLKFALTIEPNNQAIKKRYAQALQLTVENKPTLPTSLLQEKQTNLFLQATTQDEFSQLRLMKDIVKLV